LTIPTSIPAPREVAILREDPQKALALCRQALALDPHHQNAIANFSVGLRLMGDEREQSLNGYDTLVQVFDLEPPPGFSSMESFNEELCAYLEGVHPPAREHLNQTLRTGTQTPGRLFGAGHALVEKVQMRINEAVGRYIAGLPEDEQASPPVAPRPRLQLCRVLVVAVAGLRLSHQPHP